MSEESQSAGGVPAPAEESVSESPPQEPPSTSAESSPTPADVPPPEAPPALETAPSPSNAPSQPSAPDFRTLTREGKRRKREARIEKIITLAREKGKVTNNDVQKLLRVSDATATRYLRELTNRGLLRREGATKAVHYSPS